MKAELYFRALAKKLAVFTDAPTHEARDILEAVCHVDDKVFPLFLLHGEITKEQDDEIQVIIRRREQEPLAYILNRSWFYGLPFYVTKDCLIPQADTEIVTEKVIALLPEGARFADICTGSGCIALAALQNTKSTTATGYDLSEGALAVAKENAKRFSLTERYEARHGDAFDEKFLEDEMFDLIVSNPPYIKSDVIPTLSREVLSEPHMALDGGADGLLFYRRLIDICPSHIKKGGHLLFEIGYDQKDALQRLCDEKHLTCHFYCDFGGNDRVLVISL